MNSLECKGRNVLKCIASSVHVSKVVKKPFSENDILYLHNAFTTPGIHPISVCSVNIGRKVITQVLDSLKWYQDVAYLAADSTVLSIRATQIIDILKKPVTYLEITQFFIDDFYYDFLWIELTQELLETDWISFFEEQLVQLHIEKMIPIIVVSYLE